MLPGKTYSPRDFLDMARRYFWLLAIPPMLTLFAALLYSSKVPDQYQSDILIAVIPQRVPDSFVRSTVTVGVQERLDAITVLIRSRSILEPIITTADLYPVERQRLPMEDVLDTMRKSIDVEMENPRQDAAGREQPRAFHVRFSYPDPTTAAKVTQQLGSIFIDQNAKDRGAQAEATDEFLEGKLAEARQRLEAQDKLMEAFREQHGKALPTQLQSNMAAVQGAQLQIQSLVEAIARDRDRKLMLERLYQEASNEPVPTTALPSTASGGTPQPATAQQQLATARATLSNLELRLTPEHPDIIRVKRLIAELEPKAKAEAEAQANGGGTALTPEEAQRRDRLRQMKAEIESLDRQTAFKESEETRLRAQLTDYQGRIEAVPGIETEWAKLTRDYDTLQAAYKDLLTKSEASKVSVDLENRRIGEQFRIVDPAGVPVKPIGPNRRQMTAIGLLVGLLLGPGIAALLEFRDASFRTDADVFQLLSLPVLATFPLVESASEHKRTVRRRWLGATVGLVVVAGAGYVFWAMHLWTYAL